MIELVSDPEGIVISGISGVFPDSENVEEFKENLLAGNDMISTRTRYNEGLKFGQIKTIDRFDNSFFRITHHQANTMTVASRLLLEKTFEAILDAGYNPEEMKGKNIAVIGGMWECTDKGDPAWDKKPNDYIEAFGRMMFMMTNRISNWLDVHGPSYPVNTACSSALYAIDHAIKAIQRGQCEGAIVCSANFCFPKSIVIEDSPVLSHEGNSAPFDIDANGYVRAETAGVLFLQKRKHARRIYANIVHSTTNSDGFKKEGIAFPSVTQQMQLYKQFYEEINMDPRKISYIEAHGTGTKVGDIVEGTSIDEFFCVNRKTLLKIGTVKSNMGHAEAAAALCGVVKMIIAFETGIIPANLRYSKPNPKIEGLLNGHLQIVSKPTPLEGEYFALNSFGIGGSNGHIVLSPHTKVKHKVNSSKDGLPWIVTASGRTEEAVDCILSNVDQNQNDAEYIGLLHEIFKYGINGHLHRGYAILQKNKKAITSKKYFSGEKRPIWFVFSGMGSQWPAMGKSLMKIPIFAESIQRSHQVLQPKGLDLVKIITDEDLQTFDNILNSFVGIAAIQLALLDVLNKLNIKPDGIFGHSVGELGCAYADGCFTAEQMILAAYYRGLVSLQSEFVHGTMAAVGLDYESIKDQVPPEIDIACHNGPSSCTISGPTQIMQDFINQLNEKKIFVRVVNSSNIAYHSRYIASAGPELTSYLKTIILEPKLRSDKWICTSAPEHEWNRDEVKYSCAEYHTNNVLKPVLFEESYRHIPDNAIIIEIAPHGLLNAILKRSLPTTVVNIPLTMRNHENSIEYLFNALGSYESMKDQIPPEIDIACHNSATSCTISGPTEIVQDFSNQLNEKKIFVRNVDSSHIAYHSRYITSIGPKLLSYLKQVIPEPKLRSKKWICTSAPEHKWDHDEVKYSCAEYHTNNVLKPVLFEESYSHIPDNAITIEIAPHGLLNAILKRSLPKTVDNIPLTMKNHQNGVEYLLNAFGKLYEMGCDMNVSHLYPPVEFPVSKSTPMISPLIKWQHDEQWNIGEIQSDGISHSCEKKIVCNLKNESDEYIRDHIIDGRNLYPGFGYLWLVMETVAMIENKKVTEVSVVFENVHFEHALVIPSKGHINFYVSVHKLNKNFEVKADGVVVATGKVRGLENDHCDMIDTTPHENGNFNSETLPICKDDFYKELCLRGYYYKESFKNLEYVNSDGNYGEISWKNNFVTFMDAMAQTTLLHVDYRDLLIPVFIKKVVIDFEKHFKILESLDKENPRLPFNFYPYHGLLCSGGIQMRGWQCTEITRQKHRVENVHDKYQFIPYISEKTMDLTTAIRICIQIALKEVSFSVTKATTYELLDQNYDPGLVTVSSAILATLNRLPVVEPHVNVLTNSDTLEEPNTQNGIHISNGKLPNDKSALFIAVSNIQNKTYLFESVFGALKDEGFIITKISINDNTSFENLGFNVCFSRIVNDLEKVLFLRKISRYLG